MIDFGLVTLKAGVESTRLTQAHEFLGTVAYAAPEQFTGAAPDAKADQYSLGVIVYELLAGVRPIEGDGFMVLVDRHINAAPDPAVGTPARPAREGVRRGDAGAGQAARRAVADGAGLRAGLRRCRADHVAR